MVSEKIKVTNPAGFNMRAAGMLCEEAVKYTSHIEIRKGDSSYNAKSMLSVLGSGVRNGYEIEIVCDGDDEKEALAGVCNLIASGF